MDKIDKKNIIEEVKVAVQVNGKTRDVIAIRKDLIQKEVEEIIQICIKENIYIIVDYHAHAASQNIKEAKKFFSYISKKYGAYPNIIYEVWNEPLKISWEDEIRPYMIELIKTIRANDKDNIILLGTPYWCQRVDEAYKNPIDEKNIMYTAHFYTGTHKEKLRDNLDELWKAGCPIFISEFGVSIYDLSLIHI